MFRIPSKKCVKTQVALYRNGIRKKKLHVSYLNFICWGNNGVCGGASECPSTTAWI